VTAKLKKGIKGTGADYTGSILIHFTTPGVDWIA
jgi:hypothetical protein